jgi:putative transposase
MWMDPERAREARQTHLLAPAAQPGAPGLVRAIEELWPGADRQRCAVHLSAAACLAEDLRVLCVHVKYFPRLRKRFRSSNLRERSLEEVRRRTKVIGRFPDETSCLSLCWAVLDIFIAGARGLGLTDVEYHQVVQLKLVRAQRAQLATRKIA